MKLRYTITAIKRNGKRQLAFSRYACNSFDTEEQAKKQLQYVLKNNNPKTILDCVGTDLQVRPVECFDDGTPCQWDFDE